ncbi:MAG: methionyl-tRNA formyltransferase [Deltaproteobacteria bacterium]|nr:methionyl-tRNA formyltransferase [Deltaproteobacteria bacterium]
MGTPEIAVPSLKSLHKAGNQILAVVTQPDQPKGRGQILSPPPVKVAAQELNLSIWQPENIKDPNFLEKIKASQADIICVVAYGKILPQEILEFPSLGCINLHFSLLPKYRGAACVASTLMHGEDESGVTTILMDAGLDTGPILMQWTEEIFPQDTTETLSARLSDLGAQLLVKTVSGLETGNIKPVKQDNEQASYAPRLKKQAGEIDWSKPAEYLFNLYRGLTPWPGVFTFLNKKRIILQELSLGPKENFGQEAEFRLQEKKGIQVQCGTGTLYIVKLKPEGKKILHFEDFMRGLHHKAQLKFDSKK